MNLFVRSKTVECSLVFRNRELGKRVLLLPVLTTICAVGVVLKNYTLDDHSVLEFRPT